jgi:peptidyl-dipeptidase Dcp
MNNRSTPPVIAAVAVMLTQSPAALPAEASANPFAAPSPLPLHYPQFDRIRDSDFAPAFDGGMAEQLREVAAIASNPAAPTFQNTILALEECGQVLNRARTVFYALVGADTNDARNKLRAEYEPRFAAHEDAVLLNAKLFARVEALHARRNALGLDAEGVRLIERYYSDFVRSGAKLSAADKQKLMAMNVELATLSSQFSQNVLDEVNASALVVDDVKQLAGLTEAQVAAAAQEARSRGLDARYVLTLLNTTGQPQESQLTDRALRQRLHETSVARGSRGGKYDNTAIVSRTMQLRAERATLLGYPNHAAYKLEDQTARTPEAVNAMLRQLAPAAVANAKREAAELQARMDRDGAGNQ